MERLDLDVPATLFTRRGSDLPGAGHFEPKDFQTLAEAIRYAVEAPEGLDEGTYVSAATRRLSSEEIRRAYAREEFPRTGKDGR